MKLLPNLRKVTHAWHGVRNQYGDTRSKAPVLPAFSVHNTTHQQGEQLTGGEDAYTYAQAYNMLDIWRPYTRLVMSNNRELEFHGAKALQVWKAYQAVVYNG